MDRLSVNVRVERTHIVLVPVHVQLRLCTVGAVCLRIKHLELLGRHRCVKIFNGVAHAEYLRGVTVGTGPVFRVEVVEVIRIADFGVVDVEAPNLIHYPGVLPVVHPAVLITFARMFVLEHLI